LVTKFTSFPTHPAIASALARLSVFYRRLEHAARDARDHIGAEHRVRQPERRGFFRLNVIGVLLTSEVVIGGPIALALIVVFPIVLHQAGITSGPIRWIELTVEWPFLICFSLG
jgi:hypothetical protein